MEESLVSAATNYTMLLGEFFCRRLHMFVVVTPLQKQIWAKYSRVSILRGVYMDESVCDIVF